MKRIAPLFFFFICYTTFFGQTLLEYNLFKDDVFVLKQNATQVITQDFGQNTQVLTNSFEGIIEFKVLAPQENNYLITLTFKDLKLHMNSNIHGELMNVNAKNFSEDDKQSQMFNSLLNHPVQMTLSKTGDIIEVIGGDTLVDKMVNAWGFKDDFSKNMMKKTFEKEFGSEGLSNNYKQMTFIYSKNKVDVADTWTNEYYGKLQAKNTWTLESVTKNNATITGEADVLMNIDNLVTTMKLNGSQKTKIITDIHSGFITDMRVEGFSKGISTTTQMKDYKIPTSIISTITYKLIK